MPGLKTIIALSFVLAVGFLLVILSCALWKVYYPLLVVGTYVLAPLPNWVCSRLANPDDFVESPGNAVLDLGRFCTGFLVVMGIGTSSPPPSPPGFPLLACLLVCFIQGRRLTDCLRFYSPARRPRAFPTYRDRRHGHVHSRRPAHLRHHHQLRHVLPGGAGILNWCFCLLFFNFPRYRLGEGRV